MFPVDAFRNTLNKLIAILERHRIRFHLTGGLTGTAYGEPRMTQDIDIVIDPNQVRTGLDDFILSLHHSDFLFDEMTVRTGVADGQQFQLLDEVEVLKLDIYPRELIAGELSRSEQLEVFAGQWLPVVSRADATLSKLIWISKGSHKSRRDLRAIYRNTNSVQRKEILAMATDLELADLLREVLNESDELE